MNRHFRQQPLMIKHRPRHPVQQHPRQKKQPRIQMNAADQNVDVPIASKVGARGYALVNRGQQHTDGGEGGDIVLSVGDIFNEGLICAGNGGDGEPSTDPIGTGSGGGDGGLLDIIADDITNDGLIRGGDGGAAGPGSDPALAGCTMLGELSAASGRRSALDFHRSQRS